MSAPEPDPEALAWVEALLAEGGLDAPADVAGRSEGSDGHTGPLVLPEGAVVEVRTGGAMLLDADGAPLGVEPVHVERFRVGEDGIAARWERADPDLNQGLD